MVTPLFVPWKPFVHAVCAFDWAEEPTPFSVPESAAAAPLLEPPPAAGAWGSFAAHEESAIMAVRAVPMARPARRFFKVIPSGVRVAGARARFVPLPHGRRHGRQTG